MKRIKLKSFFKSKTWRVILLSSLIFMIVMGGYVFSVIMEVRLKVETMKLRPNGFEVSNSTLEADSLVLKSDLKHFLQFMVKAESVDELLKNLQKDEVISFDRNLVNIHKDIKIGALYANHCMAYRCLQHMADFVELPPALWRGLMGIEDIRFLDHPGVDIISILRAIWVDLKSMALVQGGSTLTQQLVKNIFLTSDKTFGRKFKEVIYALYLEKILEKEEIITWYFNEVFWGSLQGVKLKGITMASIGYFSTEPKFLSEYQVAILISLLKGPYFYSPLNHLERLKERTNVVFDKLKESNLIVGDEATRWNDSQWKKWGEEINSKQKMSYLRNFDYMTKNSDPLLTLYEKFVLLESTSRLMSTIKDRVKDEDVALKIFMMDNSCQDKNCETYFGHYSKQERSQKKALFEEKHQVGSTIKPLSYEVFLREGRSWDDEVSTAPITLNLKSGKWTPRNSHKMENEFTTLREALQLSENTPLVRVASEVGFKPMEDFFKDFFEDLKTPLSEYPAQLLGAIEVSVADLTASYLKYFHLVCADVKANIQDFSETVPYQLTFHEKTTIRRIASPRLKAFHFFGKTGTTNNGFDNWFVAYDGMRFYTFWFGLETGRKDANLRLSGAVSSFRVFEDFFLHRGRRVSDFECR